MTVKKLRDELSGCLDGARVMMACDEEGNKFAPVEDVEWVCWDDTEEEPAGNSECKDKDRVVLLWP